MDSSSDSTSWERSTMSEEEAWSGGEVLDLNANDGFNRSVSLTFGGGWSSSPEDDSESDPRLAAQALGSRLRFCPDCSARR